jgi:mRNA interferase ChpB
MKVFDRGDIVRVDLNPTRGREQQGDFRPCLVISTRTFNQLGLHWLLPITQGNNIARYQGFAVTLMGAGTVTQGVILANAIRAMDLNVRRSEKVEQVPNNVIAEVKAKVEAIFEG